MSACRIQPNLRDPRPLWLRGVCIAVPLAIALVLMGQDSPLGHSLGAGFASIAGLDIVRQAREFFPPGSRRARWVLPLLLLVATTAMLWPVPLGRMPATQDHSVHLARAWSFAAERLAHFRLTGWSDMWFAGWPAGEDYPPGGDIWVCLFYLGTLGLLGWRAAYALAFFAMWLLAILAMYRLGRRALGPVAGVVAAVLLLLDRGGFREGGWNFTVYWGVWPMFLSTAFSLLALSQLEDLRRRGSLRDFTITGFSLGFAMLCHPFGLLLFSFALPLYALVACLRRDQPAGQICFRIAAAGAIGGALAAGWLLPYLAKSAWMGKWGNLWLDPDQLAQRFWEGGLFTDMPSLWLWLATFGGAAAIFRRHWGASYFALVAATSLYLASTAFVEQLDLLRYSQAFSQIQYQRFGAPVKLCAMLLTGYLLQELFSRAKTTRRFGWGGYALSALALLIASPFLIPILRAGVQKYAAPGAPRVEGRLDPESYDAFLRWSREQWDKADAFYRIAYVAGKNEHHFMDAPVFNHTPMYKQGFTPASTFKFRYEQGDAELYRLLNVKYAVSLGSVRVPTARFLRRFGAIQVHELTDYTAQRHTLKGPGRVEVLDWDTERMRLQLEGTDATSRLFLHVSNYANWEAEIDGETVPIHTGSLAGHRGFIEIPARAGVLTVSYAWPWSNRIGTLLGLLALIMPMLLLVRWLRPGRLQPLLDRLSPHVAWLEGHGVHLAAAGVVMAVLGVGGKVLTADSEDFVDRLSSAQVSLRPEGGDPSPCKESKRGRFQCSPSSWNFVGAVYKGVGDAVRRCVWAHPLPGHTLEVTYPDVLLGVRLGGHHGLNMPSRQVPRGHNLTFLVTVENGPSRTFLLPSGTTWRPWSLDTRGLQGQTRNVHLSVKASGSGAWHYCFNGQPTPP